MACDLFLDEHTPGVACDNARHQTALTARASGAPSWSALEPGIEAGGRRDFLDGQPIHCGDVLELQGMTWHADDFGEYTVRLATGVPVRYELAGGSVMLHTLVAGHEFVSGLQTWMRFRWPRSRS